jgi:phenylalanyl-tRNA synthetase beta chain
VRYERGTDPLIARPVLNEAIRLIHRAKIGRAVGQLASQPPLKSRPVIKVSATAVNRLLGLTVEPPDQQRLLEQLGCRVRRSHTALSVVPPSWRYDLGIWQDIAEEIVRLSGLNEQLPAIELPSRGGSPKRSTIEWAEALKDRLVQLGLSEVQTYPFMSQASLDAFDLPVVGELANPLNPKLRFLRPSLIPNLAQVAAANQLFDPITIFEVGHVFTRQHEEVRLGIGLVGRVESARVWLTNLSDQLGLDAGQLATQAVVTELTDQQRATMKIRKGRAIFIEVELAALMSARRIPAAYELPTGSVHYRPVSRFPAVSRDVSVVVSADQDPDALRQFILAFDRWVEAAELFDEFQSDQLGRDRKSLAFHVRYADASRTLTEDDVNPLHARLTTAIERSFDAVIR